MRSIAFIINPITKYSHYFDEEIYINALPNTSLQFHYTTHSGHEIEIGKRIVDTNFADTIIVVGGDGTFNKVLQTIVGKNITLGFIPTTIGCSLARFLEIRKENDFFTAMVQKNNTIKMDLIEVDIPNIGIVYGALYFSFGFIAEFIKQMARDEYEVAQLFWLKMANHIHSYNKSKTKGTIEFNYTKETLSVFDFFIGNIDQYSGNMKVLPSANISDGILEVMLIRNVSTTRYLSFAFLRSLGLRDAIHDVAEFHKTEKVSITFDKPTAIQIDTELYDKIEGKINIRILKHSQKLLVPPNFSQ